MSPLHEPTGLEISQQYRLIATLDNLKLVCQVIQECGIGGELWQQKQPKVQKELQLLEKYVNVYLQEFSPDLEKRIEFWEGCELGKSHNRVIPRSQPESNFLEIIQGKGDYSNPRHLGILLGYRFAYLKRFLSRFELPEDCDIDLAAATFG